MTSYAAPAKASPARARLLEAASRIFYADGIRHVGVDHIISEAKVTRATFYRHFPGKEDLVLAYVEGRDHAIRSAVTEVLRTSTDPRSLLTTIMTGIGMEICRPGFRGCAFINAAAEYPQREHPVRQAVRAHRSWFRQTVLSLVTAAGCADREHTTDLLVFLRDGAMVGGDLTEPATVRKQLLLAVSTLLSSAQVDGVSSSPRL